MSSKKVFFMIWVISGLILIFCSCQKKDAELLQLRSYMTGAFKGQGPAEAEFNSKDTRLQMVQIWEARRDGYWLYREQANIINLEQPYLQRVYHLNRAEDGPIKIDVYQLVDPLRFVGAWKKKELLVELTPSFLVEKEGCSIILKKENESTFVGSTVDKDCPSSEAGAAYATTEVKITETELYSWERGFDANDDLVWGPEARGYIFTKHMDFKEPSEVQALAQEFADIEERAGVVRAIKAIRLVMRKASDISRTKYHYDGAFRTGSTTTLVFDFNPATHIRKSLGESGYKLISAKSKEIEDATLQVNYEERKKYAALNAPTIFYFSFVLKHKTAGKLIEGSAKPSGWGSIKELKNEPQFRDLGRVIKEGLVKHVLEF
jgi:hypothetical protein